MLGVKQAVTARVIAYGISTQKTVTYMGPSLNKKVFPVHQPGGLKRTFFYMIFEKSFFFTIFLVHSSQ